MRHEIIQLWVHIAIPQRESQPLARIIGYCQGCIAWLLPDLHTHARCFSSTMFGVLGIGRLLQKLPHARRPRIFFCDDVKTSILSRPVNCVTDSLKTPVVRAN